MTLGVGEFHLEKIVTANKWQNHLVGSVRGGSSLSVGPVFGEGSPIVSLSRLSDRSLVNEWVFPSQVAWKHLRLPEHGTLGGKPSSGWLVLR